MGRAAAPLTIAVDGPAASGKGTIARALARHFALPHLDTGALYRAVALSALRQGVDLADTGRLTALAHAIDVSLLEDPALRDDRTAVAASIVSAVPGVRAALLDLQRSFAARADGAVLDGRDIGTVIMPDARVKLFVTAAPAARAHRRYLELRERGVPASEEEVLADILARDRRDMGRAAAPLVRAPDSILLDTSDVGKDAAVRMAIDLVEECLGTAA
ncbi:(d)CMP kinase [Thermaurantiacus sp.]